MKTVRTLIMEAKRQNSDNRYRRYAEAKSRIPKWLPPEQYEEQVKKLAEKYKI